MYNKGYGYPLDEILDDLEDLEDEGQEAPVDYTDDEIEEMRRQDLLTQTSKDLRELARGVAVILAYTNDRNILESLGLTIREINRIRKVVEDI